MTTEDDRNQLRDLQEVVVKLNREVVELRAAIAWNEEQRGIQAKEIERLSRALSHS